jgi:very-short-patch-repair endonuclease
LEVLHDAGVPPPEVNVWIRGEEADLVWRAARFIIEIDGPDFHQFADEDARKQAIWEAAGFRVRRLPSGAVFDRPQRLIALAAANVHRSHP